jgi:hemoglobin
MSSDTSLYTRLGGYDAVAAVIEELLSRLTVDAKLKRFWENRGDDGVAREKQLLIDFLCASAGGPLMYAGRDMLLSHKGMGIDAADWDAFIGHLSATLEKFSLPETEKADVLDFIGSTRSEIVDA